MSKKKDHHEEKHEEEISVKIIGPDGEPIPTEPSEAPAAPSELETITAERDDLLARLQRLSADYQNYQKRVQKERDQERQFANEGIMKSLLSSVDDMERGLATARENHPADYPLLVGMQMVHDKLMQTLGQFGLAEIEALGKSFDPEKHLAMMQEPSANAEPMTVLRVLQNGYELKGRTLRPAAVVVATTPKEPSENSSAAE